MSTVTITKVSSKSSQDAIIANFSNGRLKSSNASDIRFAYFRHKNNKDARQKNKRILVAETDRLSYVGDTYGPMAARGSVSGLCKYMVGILNKDTGKMRLVDAQMINISPKIGDDDKEMDDLDQSSLSFVEKNDLLVSAFGSSKKKRAMVSRVRNVIKGEALEKAVDSAIAHTQLPENFEKISTPIVHAETTSVIPPYNKEAARPQDVYKLKDIISGAELEVLHEPAKVFINCSREEVLEWRSQERYAKYIIDHLLVLPISERERSLRCRYLTYLHYMVIMFKLKGNDMKKKEPLPLDMPDIIRKKFYDKFTVSSQTGKKIFRAMPARHKDTLLSYIMCLCLIIDEFQIELLPLLKDLNIGQAKLVSHMKALGCRVNIRKPKPEEGLDGGISAELVVPLTFPVLKTKTKKDRR